MKLTAVCVAGMLATLADGARIDGQYLFLSKEWTPQKQADWEDAHIKDTYIVTNQAEIRIPAPSIVLPLDPTIANKEALFPVHEQTVCDEVVEYKYTQVKYTVSARKKNHKLSEGFANPPAPRYSVLSALRAWCNDRRSFDDTQKRRLCSHRTPFALFLFPPFTQFLILFIHSRRRQWRSHRAPHQMKRFVKRIFRRGPKQPHVRKKKEEKREKKKNLKINITFCSGAHLPS